MIKTETSGDPETLEPPGNSGTPNWEPTNPGRRVDGRLDPEGRSEEDVESRSRGPRTRETGRVGDEGHPLGGWELSPNGIRTGRPQTNG